MRRIILCSGLIAVLLGVTLYAQQETAQPAGGAAAVLQGQLTADQLSNNKALDESVEAALVRVLGITTLDQANGIAFEPGAFKNSLSAAAGAAWGTTYKVQTDDKGATFLVPVYSKPYLKPLQPEFVAPTPDETAKRWRERIKRLEEALKAKNEYIALLEQRLAACK